MSIRTIFSDNVFIVQDVLLVTVFFIKSKSGTGINV